MTKHIALQILLSSLTGQENLRIKTRAGVAKALGTVLSVGGAVLLSFYHGEVLGLGESEIHWRYAEKMQRESSSSGGGTNLILGPVAVIVSALLWAVWFIVQANMSKSYPAPYTSTFYMCLMASIQCVAIALSAEHNVSAWSLHSTIRLTSALYAGTISTGLAYVLMSWTIERKGPLYVSVFSPLLLVIIAVASWALLHEQLYVGTAIGSLLIVLGLYFVLWGKNKEMNKIDMVEVEGTVMEAIKESEKDEVKDLELQPYDPSNGFFQLRLFVFSLYGSGKRPTTHDGEGDIIISITEDECQGEIEGNGEAWLARKVTTTNGFNVKAFKTTMAYT
ncbi:hypothetical protein JHK87_056043 [Glycine soja]|nr:hypothetical protein JHK87_056043 [Glycine soja]